jgi:caffeoyl-CoA O-methyltransferase
MRRTTWLCALAVTAGVAGLAGWELQEWFGPGSRPPAALARNEAEARALRTLAGIRQGGGRVFGVGDADGRLMRVLSLGLQRTGGRLTTFEIDPQRAQTALSNFRKAGVDQQVRVVVGDAHRTVKELREPIDLVFIDADKEGYLDYLNQLLPLVRPGGLILAHNIDKAPEYFERVKSDPRLDTVLFMHGGEMSVTLKKR